MTPRQARTEAEVFRLRRTFFETKDHWLSIEPGEVTIAAQRTGRNATAMVTFPRRTLDAFVDFYLREQELAVKVPRRLLKKGRR